MDSILLLKLFNIYKIKIFKLGFEMNYMGNIPIF